MALPEVISDYLVAIATRNSSIAYLQTTATGHLLTWGGDLQKYGLTELCKGDYIGDQLFYVDGFFPFDDLHEVLPHVQIEQNLTVDIHLISEQVSTLSKAAVGQASPLSTAASAAKPSQPDSQSVALPDTESKWVLLLDTTTEVKEQEIVQQQDNDLSLLRSQYHKLIGNHFPKTNRPQTLQAHKPANYTPAVHREMSILAIKVCQLESLSDHIEPTDAICILHAYVSLITQIVLEAGGVMNHVLGEVIIASFGLLPNAQPSAQQAVSVAEQLIAVTRRSPPMLLPPYLASPMAIGTAITTGRVAVGLSNNLAHPTISTLGDPVQQALQLSSLIRPDTILADNLTIEASGPYKLHFTPTPSSESSSWKPLFSIKL